MKYPGTITLERCTQSGNYRGERFPACACKQCWNIWYAKASLTPEEFEAGLAIGAEFWNDFAEFFH